MTPAVGSGVEEVLSRAVAPGAIPGASFVLTGPDGDVSEATAGVLRVGQDDPVATSTMYRLMSMTKAVASVGALQLLESGEVRLDQEVDSIVPDFGEIKV